MMWFAANARAALAPDQVLLSDDVTLSHHLFNRLLGKHQTMGLLTLAKNQLLCHYISDRQRLSGA